MCWITHWDNTVMRFEPDEMRPLLESLKMKYQPQRYIQLEGALVTLGTLNAKQERGDTWSIASGGFLYLYNLFQGFSTVRLVRQESGRSQRSLRKAASEPQRWGTARH